MSSQPVPRFHLLDKPSGSSVSLLARSLRDDCTKRGVSPRMYAHRSRVIRQQTKLLALQESPEAADESKRQAKRMRKAARPTDHREEGGQG